MQKIVTAACVRSVLPPYKGGQRASDPVLNGCADGSAGGLCGRLARAAYTTPRGPLMVDLQGPRARRSLRYTRRPSQDRSPLALPRYAHPQPRAGRTARHSQELGPCGAAFPLGKRDRTARSGIRQKRSKRLLCC